MAVIQHHISSCLTIYVFLFNTHSYEHSSPYKRSDAMYPTTVANAMHRASTVTHDFILENITAAIDQTYKEMVYDEEVIMQGMTMIASPWRNNYQSAFVNGKKLYCSLF